MIKRLLFTFFIDGNVRAFWPRGMHAGHNNAFDYIRAFSETDCTEDLNNFDIPAFIIHGDDEQIVPIDFIKI